jgi:uncharacterized coiled-coil protein SlyX
MDRDKETCDICFLNSQIAALEQRCKELEENYNYQQIVIDDLNRILSDATAENAERHGQK